MLQTSLSSSVESNSQASSAIPLGEPQRVPPFQPQPAPVTDPRDTAEYKAALELELWKEQQEELFQAQVNTTDCYICVLIITCVFNGVSGEQQTQPMYRSTLDYLTGPTLAQPSVPLNCGGSLCGNKIRTLRPGVICLQNDFTSIKGMWSAPAIQLQVFHILLIAPPCFFQQMQHRENSHMKALADEWKRRDKEREMMVKKKVAFI